MEIPQSRQSESNCNVIAESKSYSSLIYFLFLFAKKCPTNV